VSALVTACLVILVGCMTACLYRIAVGPHAIDRVLAFDLLGVFVAAALAVQALLTGSWFYLEISMGLAVLAFVGTVAAAHYIERGSLF
jgi:multicomponent Na+:H+ antiporter subunit F